MDGIIERRERRDQNEKMKNGFGRMELQVGFGRMEFDEMDLVQWSYRLDLVGKKKE